jgi:hypothetical protein
VKSLDCQSVIAWSGYFTSVICERFTKSGVKVKDEYLSSIHDKQVMYNPGQKKIGLPAQNEALDGPGRRRS